MKRKTSYVSVHIHPDDPGILGTLKDNPYRGWVEQDLKFQWALRWAIKNGHERYPGVINAAKDQPRY